MVETRREPAVPGIHPERLTWLCPRCGITVYEENDLDPQHVQDDALCVYCRRRAEGQMELFGSEGSDGMA